jgi:hypothetical protein
MPLQTHTLIEFVYLDSFKIIEIRMIQLTERRYHGTMLVTHLSFAQAPADPHNLCLINRLWSWPLHGFGLREMDLKGATSEAPTGGQRKKSLDVVYTCLHICEPVGRIQECQQSVDNVMKAMQLLTSQGVYVYRQQ